jgi:hypothetical protein
MDTFTHSDGVFLLTFDVKSLHGFITFSVMNKRFAMNSHWSCRPDFLGRRLRVLIMLLFFHGVWFAEESKAQTVPMWSGLDSTSTIMVKLQDGSSLFGTFAGSDSLSIFIKTRASGTVTIAVREIKDFNVLDSELNQPGQYRYPNPNATRYLISPSAFPLQKGEGYYQNTYLFINSVNYGITNNISVGGGFELITTIAAMSGIDIEPAYFLNTKAGFKVAEKFYAGAGALFVSAAGDSTFGTVFGLSTFGTTESNLTVGLGLGFTEEEIGNTAIITISGMHRVSRRLALISENWFAPEAKNEVGAISYGFRFMGEKLAVDLAFINNSDNSKEFFIGVPIVGFVVKF